MPSSGGHSGNGAEERVWMHYHLVDEGGTCSLFGGTSFEALELLAKGKGFRRDQEAGCPRSSWTVQILKELRKAGWVHPRAIGHYCRGNGNMDDMHPSGRIVERVCEPQFTRVHEPIFTNAAYGWYFSDSHGYGRTLLIEHGPEDPDWETATPEQHRELLAVLIERAQWELYPPASDPTHWEPMLPEDLPDERALGGWKYVPPTTEPGETP